MMGQLDAGNLGSLEPLFGYTVPGPGASTTSDLGGTEAFGEVAYGPPPSQRRGWPSRPDLGLRPVLLGLGQGLRTPTEPLPSAGPFSKPSSPPWEVGSRTGPSCSSSSSFLCPALLRLGSERYQKGLPGAGGVDDPTVGRSGSSHPVRACVFLQPWGWLSPVFRCGNRGPSRPVLRGRLLLLQVSAETSRPQRAPSSLTHPNALVVCDGILLAASSAGLSCPPRRSAPRGAGPPAPFVLCPQTEHGARQVPVRWANALDAPGRGQMPAFAEGCSDLTAQGEVLKQRVPNRYPWRHPRGTHASPQLPRQGHCSFHFMTDGSETEHDLSWEVDNRGLVTTVTTVGSV
nr:uncharacterized protein LOC105872286 isoform X1 [Microcebus murinus]